MSKLKAISILFIAIALILTVAIIPGCKATTTETTAAETTATVAETTTAAAETTAAPNPKDLYTFEKLREMANARKYEGEPAKGITLAYQNLGNVDFCNQVQQSIVDEWALAGGNPDDLTILSADIDATKAAQNADIIIGKKPNAWIQFWYDEKANALVAMRAKEAGIFMIGVDIPVQGFPFMGADNFKAGELIGNYIVDYIENTWGGWDKVDLVTSTYDPISGMGVLARVLHPLDVLQAKYGASAAYESGKSQLEGSKVVLLDTSGKASAEGVKEVMSNILSANPDAKKIVSITINAQYASGVQAAADTLGRWNPDDYLMVTNGGETQGIQMLRDGIDDGDVAYFPEKYGQYLVPAVIAYMNQNQIPAYIYMDHIMLTKDNIDTYYPKS